MSNKLPNDLQTIKKRIDLINKQATTQENKQLASDITSNLNNEYINKAGRLGSIDTDKPFQPLHGTCVDQVIDFSSIISDGGDSFYTQASDCGNKAFDSMTKELKELSFKSLKNLDKNIPCEVYNSMKPTISKLLQDKGYGYINTDELFNKSKESISDIESLCNSSNKKISESRKGLLDVILDIFSAVVDKTIQYTAIAPSSVQKAKDMRDKVSDLLNSDLSCVDITDEVFDTIAPRLRTQIMNASLVNSLINNYGIAPEIASELTIDKAFDVEQVLKRNGHSVIDDLGNIQLNKLNGFIDAQEASQIVKATTNNTNSVKDIIASDIEKQKIINTSKSIECSLKDLDKISNII